MPTLNQTFDLLFGPDRDRDAYEGRRWFRRPPTSRGPAADMEEDRPGGGDLADAEGTLAFHVRRRSRAWAEAIGARWGEPCVRRHIPPRFPYDVFAIAAHLLEHGGVYHHIQPLKTLVAGGAHVPPDPKHIQVTQSDRDLVGLAARRWRTLRIPDRMADLADQLVSPKVWSDMEPLFESWWVLFNACGNDHVLGTAGRSAAPHWWKHAWRLLAIADEAAAGTVYQLDLESIAAYAKGEPTDILWFEHEVFLEHIQRSLAQDPEPSAVNIPVDQDGVQAADQDGVRAAPRAEFCDINTLSVANPAVLNVLPKVRTPSTGCTLRSLSHHLALLPPIGVVRGRWMPNYTQRERPSGVMNLVLVPLPYSLDARSFRAALIEEASDGHARYGYFDVEQRWIRDAGTKGLIDFIDAVILAAEQESDVIHGLVFPELSLDQATFEALRLHLLSRLPSAEILIAGVSDHDGRAGNFVSVGIFPAGCATDAETRQTAREKHHRWKLDRSQLRDYGLVGVLSPEMSWWENISLQSRQVDFTVMRRDSVLAAMICEDLARVDPCQQMIRAVGPNLVVALLMDAPQVEARWPARYATVLAEDPGCGSCQFNSNPSLWGAGGSLRPIFSWRAPATRRAPPGVVPCRSFG